MNKTPLSTTEARRAARRRKRKRLKIIRISIAVAVIALLCLVGALIIMRIAGLKSSQRGETTDFLAVKNIEVEGKTRYTPEELIEGSGLYVGQSLMGVNKVAAHNALLKAFPYLCRVEVSNAAFDVLRITVEETRVIGAVRTEAGYMILGENNHALELVTEDKLPRGILRIEGASLENSEIGQLLLDERSLRICTAVFEGAAENAVDKLESIDLTEKTDLFITLEGGLQVILGNETKLKSQLEALAATLPALWKNNGEDAAGRLDMSSYSDDNPDNDKAVYTPPELLEQNRPKPTEPSASDSTDSGTAGTAGETTATAE